MRIVPHMTAQRAELINRRTALIVLGLCFVAGHAGGLGIAPLAAIAGLIGALTSDVSGFKLRLSAALKTHWIIALGLFLGWAMLSTLWSPYETRGVNNAVKLIAGVVFFEMGRRAIIRANGDAFVAPLNSAQKLMTYLPVIAAVVLCLDIASGFGLSYAIDPPRETENLDMRRADAIMNTANGIVFLTLMSAPCAVLLLWTRYRGPIVCVLLLALVIICAALNGLNVGVAAVLLSVAAMLLAARYPKGVLTALTGAAMMLTVFAPIIAALAMASSSAFRASVPFSWEHRLVTWSFVGERIREHPIMGHGFDASRTFDETFSARGFDGLSVVSLHPHNMGLHIWLELGVIGAVLAATCLYLLGQEALKFAQGGRARAMAVSGLIAPVLLISSVSYGVWQEWWWATIFVSIAVLHVVPKTKRGSNPAIDSKPEDDAGHNTW